MKAHYTKAIAFLAAHSPITAPVVTPDGVLAFVEGGYDRKRSDLHGMHIEEGDEWCTMTETFPIDAAGLVDMAPVRAWLGY